MSPPLLKLDRIFLTFGGNPLLDGADLSVSKGDRIALVGRNGSGKSTFLKIAAGLIEPMDGELFHHPSTSIRYLSQLPNFGAAKTVFDYAIEDLGSLDDPYRVTYLLQNLGLTGDELPQNLSGGEARRAAIVRALASEPDILLLDEPTNHLDLTTIEWLEEELIASKSALVLISHDRRFLERITQATIWLDRGKTKRLDKGFAHFESWRDALLEEEEREHHKLGRQIEREEHWVRFGVTARRKRNMRRMGELADLRTQFKTKRFFEGRAVLETADGRESGKMVIEAKNISKSYGSRLLVDRFSTRFQRGDRIGIVGSNGIGKTTLLKMLIGELKPDTGSVRLGVNLDIAILDQKREDIDLDQTLSHYLTDGRGENLVINNQQRHVASYMKDFLFKPEQMRTPIRDLSGGERARLILARLLSKSINVLILDEPTNDLDMETLDLLQELVSNFSGTVILISHDRDFLDRTVTLTIASNGNGQWMQYAGGYSDMLEQFRNDNLNMSKESIKTTQNTKKIEKKPVTKLSYKHKFALENLPIKIDEANKNIAILEKKLADNTFFSKDAVGFSKAVKELEDLRQSIVSMENEWLELEILKSELEV